MRHRFFAVSNTTLKCLKIYFLGSSIQNINRSVHLFRVESLNILKNTYENKRIFNRKS